MHTASHRAPPHTPPNDKSQLKLITWPFIYTDGPKLLNPLNLRSTMNTCFTKCQNCFSLSKHASNICNHGHTQVHCPLASISQSITPFTYWGHSEDSSPVIWNINYRPLHTVICPWAMQIILMWSHHMTLHMKSITEVLVS